MKTTNNRKQFIKEEILNKATLFNGNNMDALKSLPDNSIDSIVTDPPYGLSFMGKKWDHDVPSVEFWKEIFRVIKPGGHVLSFGGTRTYHRMVVNIEDAGFEIRDQIMWIYGQGFPKSHNVGEQIKKKTGNNSFEGWGTALKPANEPICVARKPISEKNIADNVLKHSTGGLNIGDSKIGNEKIKTQGYGKKGFVANESYTPTEHIGRSPSNVIIDENIKLILGEPGKFYYTAKASKKERNIGLGNELDSVNHINTHPTVKPVDLMRYLVKLVTPKRGVVLDPFMGSGSTGIAALIEDFNFVGMEMDPEYFQIAKQRIKQFDLYKDLLDAKHITGNSSTNKKENNNPNADHNRTQDFWINENLKRVS
jgi:site-specific DNA-methyltransferase (adenine-specific)